MFVQRLPRWLRRLVASLFHPHVRSYDPLPPERTAVLSASLRGDSDARTSPGTGTSGGASWLDDGRRLRPRPSPPAKLDQRLDQRWNSRPAAPRQPVPTQPQPGRAVSPRPAAEQEQPTPERPRPKPIEPVVRQDQSAAPAQPAPASQAPLPELDPPSSGDEQHIYRQLMALKRLVRLGIYNEGFDPNHVPEQYSSSPEREDDLPSE